MNKKIGLISSGVNVAAVAIFGLSMLLNLSFVSYLASIVIGLSFLAMVAAFRHYAMTERAVAGNLAMLLAGVYFVLVLVVYFAQLTVVRLENLSPQIAQLLDYQKFSLFFNYNLLGYGMMALATLFIGLTLAPKTKVDKWLKRLLLIHGVFFIACFVIPMLGLFATSSPTWIGVVILELWCLYFIPIGLLSYGYFRRQPDTDK